MRALFLGLIAGVILGGAARAQVSFQGLVTFGDSLVDNDVTHWAPQFLPLYGKDAVELLFDKVEDPDKSLGHYAAGGTTTEHVPTQMARLLEQMKAGRQKDVTLISYTSGTNDMLARMLRLCATPPGKLARVDALVDEVTSRISYHITCCFEARPDARIIVWSIADITRVPGWPDVLNEKAKERMRGHIARANATLKKLEEQPRVLFFDLNTVFENVLEQPPVIAGRRLLPPPVHGRRDSLFADPIHPSAVANAMIANALIDALRERWAFAVTKYTEAELARLAGFDEAEASGPAGGEGRSAAGR